jgi:hypothetical protein
MRGLARPTATALGLSALLAACQPAPSPAPSPTPPPTTTPPAEAYQTVTYVTLLAYPYKSGCAVVAIPYHAYVKKDGDIVWDIVDDACPVTKVEIKFAEANIVELESDESPAAKHAPVPHKQKKGKVKGAADKIPHKYTVTVDGFSHDPEIEIWP